MLHILKCNSGIFVFRSVVGFRYFGVSIKYQLSSIFSSSRLLVLTSQALLRPYMLWNYMFFNSQATMTTVDFNNVVLPGNDVSHIVLKGDNCKRSEKTIGPGLKSVDNKIIVCNGGVLRCKDDKYFWIEYFKKKYTPAKDDVVVGIVAAKTSEMYKVDIGASELATLPYLAFTNATKKNRPDIKVGNVVAAKIKIATPFMESEISCVEYANSIILGQLENGFLINVSLNYALRLRKSNSKLLYQLGQMVPYEIVIGANGKIWIHSASIRTTIAIGNAILNAEHLEEEDIPQLVKNFNKSLNI